jgi:uncharacterized OB-fold protein
LSVAVPYCKKCDLILDPEKETCPKCGSPTRFKIVRKETADKLRGKEERKEGGYIRPPSAD